MAQGEYKITVGTASASTTTISNYDGYYRYTDGTGGWIQPNDYPSYPDWNKHAEFFTPVTIDTDLDDIKKELKKLKKKLQNKEMPMKNLYNVTVISIDEEVVLDVKAVANDENEATFNAGVHQALVEKNLKPKDVTIICNIIGSVKVRKEPQKVIVEKE